MARDRKTIKKQLTDAFISDPLVIEKYGLVDGLTFEEQFSNVSVEDNLFNAISFSMSFHENIVETNAENSRPHTIAWYKEQAMMFMDGLELQWLNGIFQYAAEPQDVVDRKIIDRCAVLESNDGELVIKIAKDSSGTIEPLSIPQLTRFVNYMNLIKDAGNRLRIINQEGDKLRMTLNVYVDVSIIDLVTGNLLNVEGTVNPVKDAIKDYLSNLEFNGAFVKEFFKNTINGAVGVKLPLIQTIEWKYAGFDWTSFAEWKVAEAGYFTLEETDLTINYLPYAVD